MAGYSFVTVWRFESPPEPVWDLIYRAEQWPEWWRGVLRVEKVKEGGPDHVGSVSRYTWKSRLPYLLTFEMETTRVEPLVSIEGRAVGELAGRGRWQFAHDAGVTNVRYDWNVETTKRWMNLLAPLARPVFKWNHDVVMDWGAEGLARRLGVKRLR
ncbi:MAG TPA: SRPBCC family protein [Pyrinomonadaceae bacterium]|nr:SRPBCC family protein [Pyrinomonadaceae bacterium]